MNQDNFKTAIQEALNFRAFEDQDFAVKLELPNKSIDDCCTYIINQVELSKRQAFTDEEIYQIAYFYYENDVEVKGKAPDCRIVVNKAIELTAEEIEEAKKEAKEKILNEEYARLHGKTQTKPAQPTAKETPTNSENKPQQNQLSLF